jgi:multidrug resistance protein MdtO
MRVSSLLEFLRRELAPTPGRGSATFRLTLACLVATIPILTHRIPHADLVMIIMFLITQEDTVATLVGSLLAVVCVTIGLGSALLAWRISLDIEWLRLCFFIVFLFGGLFLKRVLTMGAIGSAIGIPAVLVMILPDIYPPDPELLTEFVLWIWWCITLGLMVNAGVQLLLSRGDPLTLLQRELATRLDTVAQTLRRLAGQNVAIPERDSLRSLAIAGMSRPLALLKSATVIHAWAHERHEALSTLITLTDRIVTSALALEALPDLPLESRLHERLLNVADGCDRMQHAFNELRLPDDWTALADEKNAQPPFPLLDIERTLDQIALAVPRYSEELSQSKAAPGEKRRLFVPDAFDNPEYVHFAIKGTLAAFTCYFFFVGFDYPGIYTSVVTCFVVSVSTIGASNQKGSLRFGGAAVGGLMGLIALVYLFPNVETIGGFWLVFGAGTAVAAWVNFGTPRISYGGYQTGLAFWKATLQDFGPALSATVARDRVIGIFFGLTVFGIIERLLWPVRAQDVLRARLGEMLHLLADLARAATTREKRLQSSSLDHQSSADLSMATDDVDSYRRRISQKVQDVHTLIESSKFQAGLIESSKFEWGDLKVSESQNVLCDAQIIFILLLSLAHQKHDLTHSDVVRAAVVELDDAIVTALQAVTTRVVGGSEATVPGLEDTLNAFERSGAGTDALDKEPSAHFAERLALYRALVAAVKQISSKSMRTAPDRNEARVFAAEKTLTAEPK